MRPNLLARVGWPVLMIYSAGFLFALGVIGRRSRAGEIWWSFADSLLPFFYGVLYPIELVAMFITDPALAADLCVNRPIAPLLLVAGIIWLCVRLVRGGPKPKGQAGAFTKLGPAT